MSILELVFFAVLGGFAGYGFAAWQEDNKKENESRREERREIMKGLRRDLWSWRDKP